MKLSRLLAGAAAVLALSTPARAQQVTLTFDDLAQCGGALTSYGSWLAIANGSCSSSNNNLTGPYSPANYLLSTGYGGTVDWSFSQGPVQFNSMYAQGWGTYYLDMYRNGVVVSRSTFTTAGTPRLILSQYTGEVDRIVIRTMAGTALGIDNLSFSPVQNVVNTPQEEEEGDPPPQFDQPPFDPNQNDPNENNPTPPTTPVDNLVNEPNATPEPATMLLVASGLGGVGAMMRRRRKAATRPE